ncbi:MAG: cell division protein FtsQ/DivIB [Myxococcota bacterium]
MTKRRNAEGETPKKKRSRTRSVGAAKATAPKSGAKRAKAGRRKSKEPSGPPVNRRKEPKKPEVVVRPPRVSLRQRMRVARERATAAWARVKGPAVVAGKLVLALIIAVGAVGVGKLVERHLRTSPAFAARDLTVEGAERLSEDRVLGAAGLARGQNVFEVAPDEARERLEGHPWIADASVDRRLPDTLRVTVREHRPAALMALDGVVYLVSEEGRAFKRAGAGDPSDLPVITGVDRSRFVSDARWRSKILREVVTVLHDYQGAGLWRREPIGEVHVEPDDGLSLYIGSDATLVRLGRGPYRRTLSKLRRVIDRLEAKDAEAAYVYLDNVRRPDRVTVKLR